MTSDVMLFENEQFGKIRGLIIDGEPWFVGKDVAEILGYSELAKAVRMHVDEDDKGVSVLDTPGGKQRMVIINESGLYSLIMASKLPSAKAFKRWVTAEVLPSIRKRGVYATPEVLEKIVYSPEYMIKIFTELLNERNLRSDAEEKNRLLEAENVAMKPKVRYHDIILQSEGCIPVTQIAKDYGMSAVSFNQMLYSYGIQYPVNRTWVLYAQYADKGYTQSKTYVIADGKSVVNTYWTQKGRKFLYEFLKECGMLPLCERNEYD